MEVTIAPAPPRRAQTTARLSGGYRGSDLLARLVSSPRSRPTVDRGLAGGLRAWLEDGIAGVGDDDPGRSDAGRTHHGGSAAGRAGTAPRRALVRDGTTARSLTLAHRGTFGVRDLRAWLTRAIFRLTVVQGPLRHPFEDALCAISVTEHGPDLLDAVSRLRAGERADLRAFARARASAISSQWHPVPAAWLPRTGERLQVPLGGGAVVLRATADLVLGRPSDGTASVCLVRLHDQRRDQSGTVQAERARRALALAETLRSGAPPWRVASYDPGEGRLSCDDVGPELLAEAVRDVLHALGRR